MNLLVYLQTLRVRSLNLGNGQVIPPQTLLDMWLITHAGLGLKRSQINKGGQNVEYPNNSTYLAKCNDGIEIIITVNPGSAFIKPD